MELSIFIAKVLGVVYLMAGIGAMTGQISFSKMLKDFKDSQGLVFMSGIFTFVLGALIIQYHNVWDGGWPVIITIVGWLAAFKGCMLMAYPKFIDMSKSMMKDAKPLGAIMLLLGLVFLYFGFVA